MAFDGGFTYKIVKELSAARDCRIDKIYQPSRDELVFLLRKKGFSKRLIISSRSGAARLHFTEQRPENPAEPPMFCMLARKHFSSAKLVEIKQYGLERIVELCFETSNEMGDRVKPKVVCELIGNRSNIILVGHDGRIIDAVRRSDIETADRIVQPGVRYEYPQSQGKADILSWDDEDICERVYTFAGKSLSDALLSSVDGFSPLVCRELAFLSGKAELQVFEINRDIVISAIKTAKKNILDGGKPTLLIKSDGTPADYSYIPIKQYGTVYDTKNFDDYSSLLDAFYTGRETAERIKKAATDIIRITSGCISRARRRLAARRQELEACADREQLRIFGELIKANLHLIPAGSSRVSVPNFYDEQLRDISIPLDPALAPSANAAHYFKEYKKSYTAEQTLTQLILKDEEEITYLESVMESIGRCTGTSDIAEIREELSSGGYIRASQRRAAPRKKEPELKTYKSVEGYTIAVGRNNVQNDYITTRLASKNDIWFHTKGIPGSHVVVFCDGLPVSDETLLFAARLAAENSAAAASSKVPVDYTPVKYVKKPGGAKPGMVIYTTNKTLFVTPGEDRK